MKYNKHRPNYGAYLILIITMILSLSTMTLQGVTAFTTIFFILLGLIMSAHESQEMIENTAWIGIMSVIGCSVIFNLFTKVSLTVLLVTIGLNLSILIISLALIYYNITSLTLEENKYSSGYIVPPDNYIKKDGASVSRDAVKNTREIESNLNSVDFKNASELVDLLRNTLTLSEQNKRIELVMSEIELEMIPNILSLSIILKKLHNAPSSDISIAKQDEISATLNNYIDLIRTKNNELSSKYFGDELEDRINYFNKLGGHHNGKE